MPRTRLLTTAVALVATAVVCWAPAVDAAAYRYWTYWLGGPAGWSFATAGPASLIPEDGSVQGWRFAVTTQAGAASSQPRGPASFAEICADTPAQEGRKRVALVLDPGTADDAPPGQQPGEPGSTCVVADADATGYQVLRSVATVRVEGGLVCAVDDYPTGECAPVVDDPTPSAAAASSAPSAGAGKTPEPTPVGAGSAMDTGAPEAADDTSGAGTPWALVGVVLVVGAVVGVIAWRRPRG